MAAGMKKQCVMGIGYNSNFELGTGDNGKITSLATMDANNDDSIRYVHAASDFMIYCNNQYEKIWISGEQNYVANAERLRQLQQPSFKIKSICTNIDCKYIFYIGNDNKLYVTGPNNRYELGLDHNEEVLEPILITGLHNVISAVGFD